MSEDRVQLFSNKGMNTFCDTFSCFKQAKWFIGRPDGPYNLLANLCDDCRDSLIRSIIETEKDRILTIMKAMEWEEITARDKRQYNGREFACKICGEVFYSPVTLATHTKSEHPKDKQ